MGRFLVIFLLIGGGVYYMQSGNPALPDDVDLPAGALAYIGGEEGTPNEGKSVTLTDTSLIYEDADASSYQADYVEISLDDIKKVNVFGRGAFGAKLLVRGNDGSSIEMNIENRKIADQFIERLKQIDS